MASKPVRLEAALVDAAAEIGRRNRRSTTQQIDYWLRIGRAVAAGETSGRDRIIRVLGGTMGFDQLGPEEREVAHAEIDARIETGAAATDFAARLAAEGVPTVTMDDSGNLVRREPDGTTSAVGDTEAA